MGARSEMRTCANEADEEDEEDRRYLCDFLGRVAAVLVEKGHSWAGEDDHQRL